MDAEFSGPQYLYRFHILGETPDDSHVTPYEPETTALATYNGLVSIYGIDFIRIEKENCVSGMISPDQLRRELFDK